MNQKTRRSRIRRSLSRRLVCERLEHRALLAALFASAELPASTPEALESETRAFITETIEQFSQASGASPEQSRVASGRVLHLNGQSVRVTDLVVEFGPIGNGSIENRSSQEVTPPPRTLTFSFIVLPSRAVSVRATILSEFGFSTPAPAELPAAIGSLPSKRLSSLPEEVVEAALPVRDAATAELGAEPSSFAVDLKRQPGVEDVGVEVIRRQPIAVHPRRVDQSDDGVGEFEADSLAHDQGEFGHAGGLDLRAVPSSVESADDVTLIGGTRESGAWVPANPSPSESECLARSLPVPAGMVMIDAFKAAGPAVVQSRNTFDDTALFQVFVSPLVGRTNSALQWTTSVAAEPPESKSSAALDVGQASMLLVTASATWLFRSRFRNPRAEPQYMITGLAHVGFLCHQDH